jgi:hypothetical protein
LLGNSCLQCNSRLKTYCRRLRPPSDRRLTGFQSRQVNSFWHLPAQSFFIPSPVETHGLIYIRSKTVYMFGNGVSYLTKWGGDCLSEYGYWSSPVICCGSSPALSSLVSDSVVIPCQFFSFQNFTCFQIGSPLRGEEGSANTGHSPSTVK